MAKEERNAGGGDAPQGKMERRVLRSKYLAVKNLISENRDSLQKAESERFSSIIGEVESLHKFVQKPREQIADAETLLDLANSLVTCAKSYSNEGVTPADFVTMLLENFSQKNVVPNGQDIPDTFSWTNLGLSVSHVFQRASGCSTMLGPMNTELKQRKPMGPRKRRMPLTASTCPEKLEEDSLDKKTDTDKNMATMFGILCKHKSTRLENLVLNRKSFAQTVENIFALSFLVKDGRVAMRVNKDGQHMIYPKNAPSAASVGSGDVSFSHFVFRFDFKDWQFMLDTVTTGDELMPHRASPGASDSSQVEQLTKEDSQKGAPTPIKKLTRNRCLVTQDQSIRNGCPGDETSDPLRQKRKRLFRG